MAICWFKVVAFKRKLFFLLQIIYFFHVLLDCNLFEMNISYSFRDVSIPAASCAVDRDLRGRICTYFIDKSDSFVLLLTRFQQCGISNAVSGAVVHDRIIFDFYTKLSQKSLLRVKV